MKKRRIRVTLGGLLGAALLVGIGAGIIRSIVLRRRARETCINNLRQIDGAKDQYSLDAPWDDPLTPSNVAIYIRDMDECYCPLAKGTDRTFENSYSINVLTAMPTCKIGHSNHNHRLDYTGP